MSSALTLPDTDLARRLLTAVPYPQRLPAGRLRPPVGIIPGDLRSLGEVHRHLAPDDRSLPGVNLAALARWVRETLGDEELAALMDEVLAAAPSHVAGCLAVHDLVGRRLTQARRVAGEEGLS